MAEPNDYITATQKNFISNDNEGRMVEKCIVEIQGTFLVKIRDYAFNGNIGENAFKHIDKFLEVVRPIKINGLSSITTWDNMVEKFIMKFHHLSDHDEEEETEEDDNPNETDNVPKIFKIEGNLFDFKTPLCEAFYEFNYLLKIDTDLFTYDIQNFKTYDEYVRELNNDIAKGTEELWSENRVPYQLCDHICEPYRFKNGETKWLTCTSDIDGFCNGGELPGMVRVGSLTYFQDHRWYDELADGKLKDETLALKAKIEGSWGDATPGVMKFCGRLKNSFENFHELDYDVLTGSYANMKTEWTSDPYLDFNRIFRRNYEASNVGDTQENQGHEEHKGNPNPEPSKCKIRRFEMMKYSFNDDEEYITIKESKYLNHSKDSLDAYRELLRLIDEGWVVTTPDE
ncbi:hypothetical protein Tco_0757710 [Tanacetum coccineum]